ncbi:Uncharacterised protein [Mycobacterium tuberculosis]|uniref:Uncharacterized protein n=1 Tax=Mycobacterium tuberculosis TaxID=1773 RepID=A0A916LBY6_MYCTX|nr:Uncharacterised protein [Mycobacterium tuberculosis]CKR64662.1 Uncharacterised protein [Mycobacterium tuberculosis]COY54109.1 Uncharacterised protein [Mycobacterium tuberculosis]
MKLPMSEATSEALVDTLAASFSSDDIGYS